MYKELDFETQKTYYHEAQTLFFTSAFFSMPWSQFKSYNENKTSNPSCKSSAVASSKTYYKNRKAVARILTNTSNYPTKNLFHSRLKMLLSVSAKWTVISQDNVSLKCSPEFFPLLAGILLAFYTKWTDFIDSSISYANSFLTLTLYSEENKLKLDNQALLSLYQYILNLYFSPTLLDLKTNIENTQLHADLFTRNNLSIISDLLVNTLFKTLSGQENFYNILLKKWKLLFHTVLTDNDSSVEYSEDTKSLLEQYHSGNTDSLDEQLPFIGPEKYAHCLLAQTRIWETFILEN